MYQRKKNALSGLDLTIITPSRWLAEQVEQSFLREYPVKVIHNGIDLTVFKPVPSSFRKKYNISESKCILLGVAFDWGIRKGLDVFIELAKRLDSQKFQVVLVGTNDEIDRRLPGNILSIHRTNHQRELAEIYSAANLFVNPTREDNYPTVNMEAIACGTPVLTFRTGGSPEIPDEKTGSVVNYNDINAMEQEILRIWEYTPFSQCDCLTRAEAFDMNACFMDYLKMYHISG